MYLVQVSYLFIGQQGLEHFLWYRPLLPSNWRIVQLYANANANANANAGGKQLVQRQLLLVQCKHQANPLLSMNNYTLPVISRYDKNKH